MGSDSIEADGADVRARLLRASIESAAHRLRPSESGMEELPYSSDRRPLSHESGQQLIANASLWQFFHTMASGEGRSPRRVVHTHQFRHDRTRTMTLAASVGASLPDAPTPTRPRPGAQGSRRTRHR
jgi:hypothetical protein